MTSNTAYLGQAIKWPLQINTLGSVETETGVNLVAQSVRRYLETPYGSEFFNPEIGSRIHKIGFEPSDDLLFVILEMLIAEAVDYEERAEYVSTVFDSSDNMGEGIVQCKIYIRVKSSNEVGSFVWPYYREKQ